MSIAPLLRTLPLPATLFVARLRVKDRPPVICFGSHLYLRAHSP